MSNSEFSLKGEHQKDLPKKSGKHIIEPKELITSVKKK
jgi:hypothetical protein